MIKHLINEQDTVQEQTLHLLKFRGIERCDFDKFSTWNDIEELFKKDSIKNCSVTHPRDNCSIHKWVKSFASNRLQGNYVSPLVLEPFVARYVIALNKIGVKTFYSCDGWHENSNSCLVIGFCERNSMVWHKVISEKIQKQTHLSMEWDYNGNFATVLLPKDDFEKIAVYKKLNLLAEFIELHQQNLLNVKIDLIENLKNKPKNNLSKEDLYNLLKNTSNFDKL